MITAQVLSERLFSDDEPCGWFAGANPTTVRFSFIGTDWTGYFVSAAADYITLFSPTLLPILAGDSFILDYLTHTAKISVTRVQILTPNFTYRLYFSPTYSYSPTGITTFTRWIGRDDYINIEYRLNDLSGVRFFVQNIKCSPNGVADLDISAAMSAFNKASFGYDTAGSLNQLQPDLQTNFVLIYTSFEAGTTFSNFIPYKLHTVRAAQQIGNEKSNNLVEYVPKIGITPEAKWLTRFEKKPVWAGVQSYLSFIYSEFIDNVYLNFTPPFTSIKLDDTQRVGINHILINENWKAAEPCFWLEGDELPDPPPPNPPPKRRKEYCWHFQNGRIDIELDCTEKIIWVLSDQFQGFFSGGTTFYINGTAYPNQVAWQNAITAASVIGDTLRLEMVAPSAVNSYHTDMVFYMEWGSMDTVVYPFWRLKTIEFSDARVGCDRMIMIRHRIAFEPTGTSNPIRVGIRDMPTTISNYCDFPYCLSVPADVAALNAVLATKVDGQAIGLHFWYGWSGDFPSGTPLVTGNVDAGFYYRYLDPPYSDDYFLSVSAGENSYPLQIPELQGNSAVYDGVTRRDVVNNVPVSLIDNKRTVIFLSFYVDNVMTLQSVFSSRKGASAQRRGFEVRIENGAVKFYLIADTFPTKVLGWFAPAKKGYNNVLIIHDGTSNKNAVKIISNGCEADLQTFLLGINWGDPYTIAEAIPQNILTFGSAFSDAQDIPFRGKIKKGFICSGTNLVLPNGMEKRCFQTVGNHNGGMYNGESYFPASGMDFYADFNFDQTGVNPPTILTSSHPLAITSFGVVSNSTFLI